MQTVTACAGGDALSVPLPQLIHARMYAQFAVIGAIGAAGLVTFVTAEKSERRSSVELNLSRFDRAEKEAGAGEARGAEGSERVAEDRA